MGMLYKISGKIRSTLTVKVEFGKIRNWQIQLEFFCQVLFLSKHSFTIRKNLIIPKLKKRLYVN